jgi:hypothetical protein
MTVWQRARSVMRSRLYALALAGASLGFGAGYASRHDLPLAATFGVLSVAWYWIAWERGAFRRSAT